MYGEIDQYRLGARAWKGTGISVRPLKQDGIANNSGVDGLFYVEVLRIVTPNRLDLNHFFAQFDLGVYDPARVLHGGSNGLLAEERFLVLQALHDQSGVGIIRRRDNDGVYAVVLDQGLLILEDPNIRTTVSGQLLGSRAVQVRHYRHSRARDHSAQGLRVSSTHAARPDHSNRDFV
jgi:hypothetical protein